MKLILKGLMRGITCSSNLIRVIKSSSISVFPYPNNVFLKDNAILAIATNAPTCSTEERQFNTVS